MRTLSDLAPGERAVILEIQGNDAIAARLMEMGLIDGEPIELIGRAPLGDPAEFALRGYRISLRNAEAKRVLVSAPDQTSSAGLKGSA